MIKKFEYEEFGTPINLDDLFTELLDRMTDLTREIQADWSPTWEEKLASWGCKNIRNGYLGPQQWARIFATYQIRNESQAKGEQFDPLKVEGLASTWKRTLQNLGKTTHKTNDTLLKQSAVGWFRQCEGVYTETEFRRLKLRKCFESAVDIVSPGLKLEFDLGGSYQAEDITPLTDETNSVVHMEISKIRNNHGIVRLPTKVDIHFRFGPDNEFQIWQTGYAYISAPNSVQLILWDFLNDMPVYGTITRGTNGLCAVGNVCVTLGERQFEFVMKKA